MTDTTKPRKDQTYCVIVPAFMEQSLIGNVVRRIKEYAEHVVVVDDGSTDQTAKEAENAGAVVIRHERNQGKGASLADGFKYARDHGYDYLITLDADGQHNPSNIPRFIRAYIDTGIPAIIGNRMNNNETMPKIRKITNKLTSWYLSREMGQFIPDTQCGFRLFRSDVTKFVPTESQRYAAESEILLHIAHRGIRMDSVPVATIYGDEKSEINPIGDAVRFFAMLLKHKKIRHH